MPNAKEARVPPGKALFVLADTGAGKTTQFLTFPGKKYAYIFDPNALSSLQGYDVEYDEFLPDKLNLKLTSLKAGQGDKRIEKNRGAEVYNEWEKDFETKMDKGFFDPFESIMMDSGTTLLDMIMDGVLAVNGRGGMWPQQDDYGPQMLAFQNIMRTLTSMGKRVYVTGHVETIKDDIVNRVFNVPMMTGRLKKKIPLLFSEVLFMEAVNDGKGKIVYRAQMRPDRMNPTIRCSLKDVDAYKDVTLDFSKPLEGQGLGGLYTKSSRPVVASTGRPDSPSPTVSASTGTGAPK